MGVIKKYRDLAEFYRFRVRMNARILRPPRESIGLPKVAHDLFQTIALLAEARFPPEMVAHLHLSMHRFHVALLPTGPEDLDN